MNYIEEFRYKHPLYSTEIPSYGQTDCSVFYNIEHCSSYEYGYNCRTCVHYNPLRVMLNWDGNNTGIPDEVVRQDAIRQVENFRK